MPSRPWYKWFPADYRTDTSELSDDADLLYRRLLDLLWERGPQPLDERRLAKMLRLDPRKFRRIFPEVLPKISVISGLVDHPKIAKLRAQQSEFEEKQRQRGRNGGLARARARDRDPDPDLNTKGGGGDSNSDGSVPRGTPSTKKSNGRPSYEQAIEHIREWAQAGGDGVGSHDAALRADLDGEIRQATELSLDPRTRRSH